MVESDTRILELFALVPLIMRTRDNLEMFAKGGLCRGRVSLEEYKQVSRDCRIDFIVAFCWAS